MLSRFRAARASPKTKSFAVVAVMFPALLLLSLAASWQAIEIVNETRAYAVGEGRYSKAQKMAVLDLYRYAHSENDADFRAFFRDILIPRGDETAQKALSHSPADIETARRGLLAGNNHPSDIDGLINLYRRFYWWRPFAEAVDDWRIADMQVEELVGQALRLHERVSEGKLTEATRRDALRRIEALDEAITERENTFSTHMGEASRLATMLVVVGIGVATVLLWAIGIAFAVRMLKRQIALDSRLSLSEQRFRDYAEVASDWYWETDARNRIVYVSVPNGMLGTDAALLVRRRADNAEQGEETLRALSGRRPFRGLSLRFNQTYQAISGKPRFGADGTFLGYRGVGTDITAQVNDAARAARRQGARRSRQPRQVRVPRQYEPRAAHAPERGSRLLRHHPWTDVRRATSRTAMPITPTTSTNPARICSRSSTTSSTSPRSRPAASRCTRRNARSPRWSATSSRSWARRTKPSSASRWPKPMLRLRVDSRKFRQILVEPALQRLQVHARRRDGDAERGRRERRRPAPSACATPASASRRRTSRPCWRPSARSNPRSAAAITAPGWACRSPSRSRSCTAARCTSRAC